MPQKYSHLFRAQLEVITKAQSLFIANETNQTVFDGLLRDLLALTESEYGFIGEVFYTAEKKPYLKTHAITNIAWNEETRAFYEANAPTGMEFYNLKTLFGKVLTTEKPVIANQPATDSRAGGIPPGHPALLAFLGVPIMVQDKMIAMIGLANRPDGYDEGLIAFLHPLLSTIGQLINAQNNMKIQRAAEQELLQRDTLLTKLTKQLPGMFYQFVRRTDGSYYFPFSSEGVEAVFGCNCEELMESADAVMANILPEDLPRVQQGVEQSAQQLSVWSEIFRYNHPTKGIIWVEGRATPEQQQDDSVMWHGFISDITSRMQSHFEYKRAALVAESTDSAVIITDKSGHIEWVNKGFCELTGFTLAEVVGNKPGELLQGELTDPQTVAYMSEQLQQNRGFEVELINYNKDGTPYWIAIEVQPVISDDGSISNFIAIEKDITQRKQIEHELLESTRQLELVLASTSVGIWDWQVQTGELAFNERWANIIGYNLSELEPVSIETWLRFAHPDDAEQSERLLRQHWQGETEYYIFEARMRHKNGHWVWVLDTGKVVEWENDKPKRMIGTHLDITERKQVEMELQRNEALMRGLFELSPLGIALNDFDTGVFLQVNEALISPSGYSRDEFVNLDYWQLTPKDYEPQESEQLQQLIATGRYGPYEKEYMRKDGSRYPVLLNGILIDDVFSGSKRIWSIVENITDRKLTEKRLIDAKNAAEAAAEAKSSFLARMSHEIRTPMNGVLGMLNLLSGTSLTESQRHKLSLAQSSGESLLHVINDILDFSKVDAGKMELDLLEFDLRTLLGDFAEAMAQQVQSKNLELILDLTAINETLVVGDANRIRQILTNLVGNAVKFTQQGEIAIVAGLQLQDQQLQFRCQIIDTGIGIPEDKQDNLFDSFSQVDASTTRKYGGTGLGLAICKKLCELMSGTVTVSSEADRGSCFEVVVLLQPSAKSQKLQPPFALESYRLLLAEHNQHSREVVAKQLQHWGAVVEQATSASELLRLCRQHKFDLLLLDNHLSDINGCELAQQLQQIDNSRGMRMVLMTAMSEQQQGEHFLEAGFSSYFPKPVTTADLFAALQLLQANVAESQKQPAPLSTDITSKQVSSRVLLVEDNMVNQLVATGMLQKLGVEVDIAEDGVQALATLQKSGDVYDLIFMDCQMPNMDGYEATKKIRAGDGGESCRRLPIIAMTANAMEGDRERCLTVGMDDYLPKPIDPQVLQQKLHDWLNIATTNS